MAKSAKPEVKPATIRIPAEVWALLDKICDEELRSRDAVLEILIRAHAKKIGVSIKPDKKS